MPDTFFGPMMESVGVRLPPVGEYAVGQVFLPKVRIGGRGARACFDLLQRLWGGGARHTHQQQQTASNPHPPLLQRTIKPPPPTTTTTTPTSTEQDEQQRDTAKRVMEAVAAELGHEVLAWRVVPTDNRSLGASAVKVEPTIEQWFVSANGAKHRQLDAEGQVRG